jgi:hypothetical protein
MVIVDASVACRLRWSSLSSLSQRESRLKVGYRCGTASMRMYEYLYVHTSSVRAH